MLRMGRSPKVDSHENQPHAATQPQPTGYTAAQNAYAQPREEFDKTPPHAAHEHAFSTPTAPRAVTESEALARDLKEGVISGFIGSGTVVSGDAEFKGMLRIDGHFTGRIRSEKGSLIVSAGGKVDANVEVASARINGDVNGDIVATQRIELGRSARVNGNIQTPALVVEEGAIFEGSCRMRQKEAVEAKAPKGSEAGTAQAKPAASKQAQTAAPVQTPLPRPVVQKATTVNAAESSA
jgi:cytoskeletal protein CcmA (bactofilin family)